jgi:hypothetical protein
MTELAQATIDRPLAASVGASQDLAKAPAIVQPDSAPPVDPKLVLRELQRKAVERYAAIESYCARLRRREQVNGKDSPEEIIAFSFRKQPWSIHMKWLGTEGQGREVIYVKGRYEGKIHTLLGPSDRFFMAGKVVSLTPDSPLVLSRCRYPITEAGIGPLIERFGQFVYRDESGKSRALHFLGPQKRPEYDQPLDAVEQVIAPGEEPTFPAGGRRWWFFESTRGLPVLVVGADPRGHEVEYYCFDRLQSPVGLDDDDFDPAKRWKGKH